MRIAAVSGGTVIAEGSTVATDLVLAGGRISALADAGEALPLLNASGLSVLPGFIDIHTHGGAGHSFFTSDPERLAAYSAWAPARGVTSYLASLVGDTPDQTRDFLSGLRDFEATEGARCLGFHLEGPFINPARRGAFPDTVLRSPDSEEFLSYQHAAAGRIRLVTLAPELDSAPALIEAITASGATAAIGHTDATFAQATAGFEAGASHVTHLFNAMRPLHHREGGPVAAALASTATCELIFDNVHVGADVLRLAYRMLGPDRTVVVTDNLYLAGADRSSGEFAGGQVSSSGAVARRQDDTIVGSLLPMDGHARNVAEVLGAGLDVVARLCSTNPARAISEHDRGSIARGKYADLVLLDEGLEVVATVCEGNLVYLRPGDEWRYSA